MARVAILGATGNVGTAVLGALRREGDEIVALARRPPDAPIEGAEFQAVDMSRDDVAPHLRGVDALVHLAWQFHPMRDPLETWRANVLGTGRVLDAVVEAGVRAIVYASSVGAYSPGPNEAGDAGVDESWPTHSRPTVAYGREKAYVERMLDRFELARPNVRVARVRSAFVFQRIASTEQRRIFAGPFLPRSLVEPGRLPVVPYPAGFRFQAVHASDLADAYSRLVHSDAQGAFNVAAPPQLGGAEVAEVMGAELLEVPVPIVRSVARLGWLARLVPTDPELLELARRLPKMSTRRIAVELGWQPTRDAMATLREMLWGMRDGAGAPTEPLAPDTLDRRLHEVQTGVGARA
jgi:nucleoside-diphosphate-sugar epimerase